VLLNKCYDLQIKGDGRGTWGEEEKCSQGFSREGNPEGKLAACYDIHTHTHTHTREDNIKIDLKEKLTEVVVWISQDSYKDQWQALGNTVMNQRVASSNV
jgi:hypothetical protein